MLRAPLATADHTMPTCEYAPPIPGRARTPSAHFLHVDPESHVSQWIGRLAAWNPAAVVLDCTRCVARDSVPLGIAFDVGRVCTSQVLGFGSIPSLLSSALRDFCLREDRSCRPPASRLTRGCGVEACPIGLRCSGCGNHVRGSWCTRHLPLPLWARRCARSMLGYGIGVGATLRSTHIPACQV